MLKLIKRVFSPGREAVVESKTARRSAIDVLVEVDLDFQARGNVLLAAGNLEDAAACYRQAFSASPTRVESLINLGYVLTELRQTVEATRVLLQAVTIDPENVDARYILAKLGRDDGQVDEAIESFKRVLAIKPDFEAAYIDLCDLLEKAGRDDEARSIISNGIALSPNVARYQYILGTLHVKANAHDAAIACFKKAIDLQPDYANLHFQLSTSLYAQGRLEEVVESLQAAIALKPDYVEAYSNLGTALLDLNRLKQALGNFRVAIGLCPDHAESHFNIALCLLRLGEFESGFLEYEWRWKDKRFQTAVRHFAQPLWLGKESIECKTILLHAEQGLGDTIQFCRYAELVADRGATVLLQVPKALHLLLSELKGVSRLLEMNEPLPHFDYHCPILSLPRAFGTSRSTVPCRTPYLTALPQVSSKIRQDIGSESGFRIGICWKGNASYPRDADRSPGIDYFERLIAKFRGNGAKFYTLLPDSRDLIVQIGGEDLGYELDSTAAPFTETAALIANLDLVITCDTSIGHVAGALGKPVWTVLPYAPDWRWIGTCEDSPWYPNTRLFHQIAPGNWEELFSRVADRLNKVLTERSEPVLSLPRSMLINHPSCLNDKK